MEIERYLRSKDRRYFVPDSNVESAKILIFECYPTAMDLKAENSVSALKTWNGIELFDNDSIADDFIIGTAYISNVPLYPIDEYTKAFTGEFEGIRLSPRVEIEYLRQVFKEKMCKIIENENIRILSYKLEMFKHYYDDFLKTAEVEIVNKLNERLDNKTLEIMEFPRYTLHQIRGFEACYNNFKTAFDNITK